MAKAGKLGKLLKKMQSIGRTSFNREIDHDHDHDHHDHDHDHHDHDHDHHDHGRRTTSYNDTNNLSPVYVGKSRRRYMVSSEVVDHPLFRELVERSSPESGGVAADDISVNCEVVLFEHLLWMLENADPQTQPESLDELVDFYAY